MGIVRTNKKLFKFSLTKSSICDFCGQSLDDKKPRILGVRTYSKLMDKPIKQFKQNWAQQ